MPQLDAFGLKLIVRSGISISALHPISLRSTRAFQMPSHERFTCVPLPASTSPSPIAPDGLISK